MFNIKIINFNDDTYPIKLRQIKNPPKELYTDGNIDLLYSNSISIVGTRHPTNYGIRNTKKFTKQITSFGITIVSGMALGIDAIAHNCCINNNGKTIAVIPCGFDNIFPIQNLNLYHNILNTGGLIISEYPPEEKYSIDKAIARNRIVVGLSMCTIVIEASKRSGTSITAQCAREQGKNVFCIPGNLENKYSVGTNNLIKKGANILTCIDDITEIYPFISNEKTSITQKKVPDEYKKVYDAITDIAISIEELKMQTRLDTVTLNSQLSMLELEGYIEELPGGCYIRNEQ